MVDQIKSAVLILRALGDETRIKIMEHLVQHDYCVRALSCSLACSEASVSQHLKILREAGLVRGEKRGYWVHYSVCSETIQELLNSLYTLIFKEKKKDNGKRGESNGISPKLD